MPSSIPGIYLLAIGDWNALRFLGQPPLPPCSEAYQGATYHQQSCGLRHHPWSRYVYWHGLASTGDEDVGNEEVADIIRDGQLGDRRIGNSKSESRECWR